MSATSVQRRAAIDSGPFLLVARDRVSTRRCGWRGQARLPSPLELAVPTASGFFFLFSFFLFPFSLFSFLFSFFFWVYTFTLALSLYRRRPLPSPRAPFFRTGNHGLFAGDAGGAGGHRGSGCPPERKVTTLPRVRRSVAAAVRRGGFVSLFSFLFRVRSFLTATSDCRGRRLGGEGGGHRSIVHRSFPLLFLPFRDGAATSAFPFLCC